MRALYVIAVTAILIAGFKMTVFSFAGPTAREIADGVKSPSGDVSQARGTAELPIQKIHDMSIVFSRED